MSYDNLVSVVASMIDGDSFSGLQGPLAEAMKVREKQQSEAAANELIAMLSNVERFKKDSRDALRRLRKNQTSIKKGLANMDRALAYGNETSNFLPVLHCLGMHIPAVHGLSLKEIAAMSKVPSDWVPSEAQSAPPVTEVDGAAED